MWLGESGVSHVVKGAREPCGLGKAVSVVLPQRRYRIGFVYSFNIQEYSICCIYHLVPYCQCVFYCCIVLYLRCAMYS